MNTQINASEGAGFDGTAQKQAGCNVAKDGRHTATPKADHGVLPGVWLEALIRRQRGRAKGQMFELRACVHSTRYSAPRCRDEPEKDRTQKAGEQIGPEATWEQAPASNAER